MKNSSKLASILKYKGRAKALPFDLNPPYLFIVFIALTGICFFPGVSGPFLFDDFGTLPGIGSFGGVDDLQTFFLFLTDNDTGAAGRPVSLLSFLLNATTWPADPWAFKLTNLAIHLVTGVLVYLLTLKLLRSHGDDSQARWTALLVASFWLLNPLNVSTVLYVVQRMAMLSALFMLLGLLAYVHGRGLLTARPRRAYGWMSASVMLFAPLAILSKENGALLPLLILVVEYSLPRHTTPGKSHGKAEVDTKHFNNGGIARWWAAIFLWLPSLALLVVLFRYSGAASYAGRDFSITERLLTESRVLFEYLWYWFNPFATSRGVLADGYVISRDLLTPWATMPAVTGVLALIGWAAWQRKRHPLASLAILFFFAGHLMESTTLPLEIYFEHRNYLPSIFLILPVAAWVIHNNEKHRLLLPLAAVILLAQGFQTHKLANIWGDELKLAIHWAQRNPNSSRAQDYLASSLSKYGRPDLAVAVMEKAIRDKPENSHYYLHHLVEKCAASSVTSDDWARIQEQFSLHPLDKKSYPLLTSLVDQAPDPACRGVTVSDLQTTLKIMTAQPSVQAGSGMLWQLRHMQGKLHIKSAQVDAAMSAFQESLRLQPSTSVGMQQVASLASHGYFRQAISMLETVEKLPRPVGWRDGLRSLDYDAEIRRIRKIIEEDLRKIGEHQ